MKLVHTYFYHPDFSENNQKVIEEFESAGVSMFNLQQVLGRQNRYVIPPDSEETTLSMGIEAARGVLNQSHTPIEDIDIIVFVSSTPEHQVPCDAIQIHQALNAKINTLCYDMNANCIAAVIALDQISKYLSTTKNARKALIICAEKFSATLDPKNPITAFCLTDSAFAFIIEDDESDSGLLDVIYHTDSSFCNTVLFPPNGYSCYQSSDVTTWSSIFDGTGSVDFATENIQLFLDKNHLTLEDIDLFLFSQFSHKNIQTISKFYNIPQEKIPFYSREIGYTGSSSPFLALHQYQNKVRKLKKGDYILIWTLGAGYQAGLLLWKY